MRMILVSLVRPFSVPAALWLGRRGEWGLLVDMTGIVVLEQVARSRSELVPPIGHHEAYPRPSLLPILRPDSPPVGHYNPMHER